MEFHASDSVASQCVDDAVEVDVEKHILSVDNLDEIRRVTDTDFIATTESNGCLFWDTTALCVAGDERASATAGICSLPISCAANACPFIEDEIFEISTEEMDNFSSQGTFQPRDNEAHDQGGVSSEGVCCTSIATSLDRRKYRLWVGKMNLHIS
jgi:hypothetical protein